MLLTFITSPRNDYAPAGHPVVLGWERREVAESGLASDGTQPFPDISFGPTHAQLSSASVQLSQESGFFL